MENAKYNSAEAVEILCAIGEELYPDYSRDERRQAADELLKAVASLNDTPHASAEYGQRHGRCLAVIWFEEGVDVKVSHDEGGRGGFVVSMRPEFHREPLRVPLVYSRRLKMWVGREYDPAQFAPPSPLRLRRSALAEVALAVGEMLRRPPSAG